MAAFVVGLVLLLAMAALSDASYCVCNSGASDQILQKNIDYACGTGADCSAILQNGPCYNPNTVRDHCNYAVNSYYQRKGQVAGSCDFQGTATVTQTPPGTGSGCVYQSSPSNGVSTTPTGPTMGGTPTTGGTTTVPGSSTVSPSGGVSLGPTGSGFSNTDSSNGEATMKIHRSRSSILVIVPVFLTPVISGLMM
ncbi:PLASMODESMATA CALLOSE-BINDING PROTEIN 3-like [Andrographis paniculata]|uniref:PLASMODESMATA CALLOSE-BINDING PROTEIN 3-like n=1 Tax=Andrographis paniculata TaxID=175694 RepID=UPI0021E99B90|nr:PLASMODESMATA CALLOSE-BINDING PROTEIN 3-like [Andrographis paniculata]